MSADCLFVLRNAREIEKLKIELEQFCLLYNIGILYTPMNALIECGSVDISEADFAFHPTDGMGNSDSSLLLSYEGACINGRIALLPLRERMEIIERIAKLCGLYAEEIEIYLSEDNPYLPDYTTHNLPHFGIAELLFNEYQLCLCPYPHLPNVFLHISRTE